MSEGGDDDLVDGGMTLEGLKELDKSLDFFILFVAN